MARYLLIREIDDLTRVGVWPMQAIGCVAD